MFYMPEFFFPHRMTSLETAYHQQLHCSSMHSLSDLHLEYLSHAVFSIWYNFSLLLSKFFFFTRLFIGTIYNANKTSLTFLQVYIYMSVNDISVISCAVLGCKQHGSWAMHSLLVSRLAFPLCRFLCNLPHTEGFKTKADIASSRCIASYLWGKRIQKYLWKSNVDLLRLVPRGSRSQRKIKSHL